MMSLRQCAFLLGAVLFCATAANAQTLTPQGAMKAKPPDAAQSPAASQQKPAAQPGEIERITVEELKEKLAKKEPVTIIDSRSQASYDGSNQKIKGAIRIPMSEIESRLNEIPRDKEIVVYCT